MNATPPPDPDAPRRPVFTPLAPRTPAPVKRRPAIAARRFLSPAGASLPAPGSVVRCLISTRGWALINGVAFLLFGIFRALQGSVQWRQVAFRDRAGIKVETSAVILQRLEIIFTFALAAGCTFAATKLFRYSAAISRLRQASRMHELENALRHQRIVWIVLGALGAMWLALFVFQMINQFTEISGPDNSAVGTG